MTGVITTIPKFQFLSSSGAPLAGGTLTSYLAGTTTPAITYQDVGLVTENTNPIELDSRGECLLWLDSTKSYKFLLKNAGGVSQWTVDNITGAGASAEQLRAELVASGGSASVGYLPDGDGAVATTVQVKLRESVSVLDKGGDPTGVVDLRIALAALANYTGEILLPPGTYTYSSAAKVSLACSSFKGYGATINFTSNVAGTPLTFTNVSNIEGVVFDGNGHSFHLGNDHYLVRCFGTNLTVKNCTFQNATASTQGEFQYALGIDWNCNSVVESCTFNAIYGITNAEATSGFCGGIFIATDYDNPHTITQAAHLIQGCSFVDIKTLTNGTNIFPDSDGIRNYVYYPETLTPTESSAVYNTTVSFNDCIFLNVLKSGVKLNNCVVNMSNSRFKVTDAHGQPSIYCGFRYQSGPFCTFRNLSISGLLISCGVANAAAVSVIDAMYFTTTYSSGACVALGNGVDNQMTICTVSNVVTDSASAIANLQFVSDITFDRCLQTTEHTESLIFASDVAKVVISNCKFTGQIKDYVTPAYTIASMLLVNSTLTNSAGYATFASAAITSLKLSNCSVANTGTSLVYRNAAILDIADCDFSFSGSLTYRPFDLTGGAKLLWTNSDLADASGKDITLFSDCPENRINGMISTSNATTCHFYLYRPNTVNNSVFNVVNMGGNAKIFEADDCTSFTMTNIRSEVAGGYIELFYSAPGGKAVINGFSGLLAATPVVINVNGTLTSVGVTPL